MRLIFELLVLIRPPDPRCAVEGQYILGEGPNEHTEGCDIAQDRHRRAWYQANRGKKRPFEVNAGRSGKG